MQLTYPAVLRDDRLEWGADGAPPVPPAGVRVHVTLLDPMPTTPDGRALAAALDAIAATGGPIIPDPAEWEREVRADRPLPGRGE